MKTLATLAFAFAATILLNVDTAAAQQGYSTSWSNSYSYSWNRSWGYGPGGSYNNYNSQQSQRSTYAQNNYAYNPYTGGYSNNGFSRTNGYNSNYGYSNGVGAYGPYGSSYGGYNPYSSGRTWRRWG